MKTKIFCVTILFFALLFVAGYTELFAAGCTYYVDENNTTGPWDGSEENPYQTIGEATNAGPALTSCEIYVKEGIYEENINLRRNHSLQPWGTGNPEIRASGGSPAILADGANSITGFIIEGGSAGIQMDFDAALPGTEISTFYISDCEIRGGHYGIKAVTPETLDLGDSVDVNVEFHIKHNYIHNMSSDGIHCDLTGPLTGTLTFSMDVTENVIEDTARGVFLHVIGQEPTPVGSLYREAYTGFVDKNLIFNGRYGIVLSADNNGQCGTEQDALQVRFNTIANSFSHGIEAHSYIGPNGKGRVRPYFQGNIIAENGGNGIWLHGSGDRAHAGLDHNVFYNNIAPYKSDSIVLDTEIALNLPKNHNYNRIADPVFSTGPFLWMGAIDYGLPAAFYLNQAYSPAVNIVDKSASSVGLSHLTTDPIDQLPDAGLFDAGYHYRR